MVPAMSSLAARVRRFTGLLLADPAVVPSLTGFYIVAGVAFVLTGYTLNNEGLLTHYWASWARQDFLPVFFYQKVKPVLCVLYAPVSALGSRVTLIAHVVVAALAIPFIAGTARALGYRLPNLPALAVALSPVYFYAGSAGFSNVDGVTGIALVLYLLCARRAVFLAGVVAGLLPWVRFELVTFSAVMALYALLTEADRRVLWGMMVFPLLYAATGALYHHDPLWMAHFPPSAPFDPGNPIYQGQHIGLQYLLEPLVALTPLAALAAAVRLGRLQRVERAVLAYTVLTAFVMNVFPILRLGNFGSSQRYSLHLLPALALLVGRAIEPWWEGERPRVLSWLATALLVLWVSTRYDARTAQVVLALSAVVLVAACFRAGAVAAASAAALAVIGPVLPLRTEVLRMTTAPYLDPMVAWLDAHPEQSESPIYTNAQLLGPRLERREKRRDIHHLAGIDMARELVMLTNPDNGQRERIERLCAIDLYGKTLLPPIAPNDLPRDALLVLRIDPRLPLLLPEATWSPRLEIIAEEPTFRIARIRSEIR